MKRKITAIKTQKRNSQRVNIYLDGEFAFGLSRIVAARLQIGKELDKEKIVSLKAQDQEEKAYQRVLNYLSYRLRSEQEVRQFLKRHEFSDLTIDAVIQRLHSSGLVDDHMFAELWVENRLEFRPRGRRALAAELRQKGINNNIIDDVLHDIDDNEVALQLAQKQASKYEQLDWQEFRRKLSAYLARRGFYYQTIAPIVKQIWSELEITSVSQSE